MSDVITFVVFCVGVTMVVIGIAYLAGLTVVGVVVAGGLLMLLADLASVKS